MADPVLTTEREQLRRSREYLHLMREDVLSLKAMAGDRVSEEYLKADLYHRAEALKDIPDAPLFFGRLDYAPQPETGKPETGKPETGKTKTGISETGISGTGQSGAGDDGVAGHSFHIGRRHVHAPDGTPAVIDWRAPVSRPFYRASGADPMNVELRRRFGFSGGELTAYEDELFATDRSAESSDRQKPSQILIDEIERPRSGPMRDIVATIQPDQDDIVRAGATQTVCVQGAPGTGKTAVGLHRVAYLLYAYREQVRRRGVVMIGPNQAFLSYIRNVLPALGELDVAQTTVGELVKSMGPVPVRGSDADVTAVVKGDARMAEVLRRALWSSVRRPSEAVVLARGARRWRVAAYELEELTHELRHRGVRYGAARELLEHRIAHVILTRMEAAGEACDDRTHEAVRRSRPVRSAVETIWPKVDPVRLVFGLLSSAELLAAAADGILTPDEQAAIVWSAVPRSPGSARWSPADTVLIDEARDLITRTPSLAHVVIDEAQDLSPMECRALGRRCSTGAATVLGDLAQGTTPWAASSWAALLSNLGKPDTDVRELSVGYRVPRQILDYASSLLAVIAPELRPASSLRADPGALSVTRVPPAALDREVVAACAQACTRPGSVAVIAADPQVRILAGALDAAGMEHGPPGSDARLTLVPVTLAKGLEFDHVIVVEPARIARTEARGLQRLYVALTRAVSRLTVLYTEPLPAPLPAG
ncbi:MAG TPA: ATP-binding domain-containing protein [Streptosporangiaceae bacterium]|nr:ATP-binding domain-containing protein [Streptosporangiaceae bacterium]